MHSLKTILKLLVLLTLMAFYMYEITILTEFIRTFHGEFSQEAIAALYGLMVMFGTGLKMILEHITKK